MKLDKGLLDKVIRKTNRYYGINDIDYLLDLSKAEVIMYLQEQSLHQIDTTRTIYISTENITTKIKELEMQIGELENEKEDNNDL